LVRIFLKTRGRAATVAVSLSKEEKKSDFSRKKILEKRGRRLDQLKHWNTQVLEVTLQGMVTSAEREIKE